MSNASPTQFSIGFARAWRLRMAIGWTASCSSDRARGDHKPDADYDIAVFIHGPDRWLTEVKRLASLGTGILLDTGAVISAKPFRAKAYEEDAALMREIRRDGVPL